MLAGGGVLGWKAVFFGAIVFLVSFRCVCGTLSPRGHLEAFGKHREREGNVEERWDLPSGREFYRDYIAHHRPVVFKGASREWPASSLFTDEWLAQKMGSYRVRMETKDDDKTRSLPPMAFDSFIKQYRSRNLYLVDEVPPPLMPYIHIPSPMRCHNITSKFFVTFLWLSSGDTASKMHIDTDENMLCVLEGTKVVYLVEPRWSRWLYADRASLVGVSPIDPLHVDLKAFPLAAEVPFTVATVQAGDCLYLPQNWWHFVVSSAGEEEVEEVGGEVGGGGERGTKRVGGGGRNLAVAMWWKSRPPMHLLPFRKLSSLTHPFADVVDAYEDYVQRSAPLTPEMRNCSEQKFRMSDFEFASDRTEDGEYGEDDKAERDEYDWVNPMAKELGLEEPFGNCQFNLSHSKNPCFVSACMHDDDSPLCIRYMLDYCRHNADNGCMDLVWLLNKKQRLEYRALLLLPDLYATPRASWPKGIEKLTFDTLPDWARVYAKAIRQKKKNKQNRAEEL